MTGDTAVRVRVDDVLAQAAAECRALASIDSEVRMSSMDSRTGGDEARMCYRILGRSSVDIIKSGG
jgi:hypothetical protein